MRSLRAFSPFPFKGEECSQNPLPFKGRVPEQFRFQLTRPEVDQLVTNCDRFSNMKHSSVLPYAFNEQGVAMLSAVLRSEKAVQTSIQIIDTFVKMRQFLANNADLGWMGSGGGLERCLNVELYPLI